MPNRSSKTRKPRPRDVNQLAKALVDEATADPRSREPVEPAAPVDPIRQAAAEMGRRGGLKGGPARAAKLTKKQLSESAKKAATARWAKKQ